MATINATMSLSSDITGSAVSVSKTMTMTKAGSTTGLDKATGLIRKAFTSTNHVDLLVGAASGGIAEDVTKNKAAKLYIKNVGTDSSEYFIIGMGKASGGSSEEGYDQADSTERYCSIGRLYGGDWMLVPWDAEDTNGYGDITIKPSVATTMTVEYMVFFE
tara:strand:- start:161 stop:643 length:483 start_codon:yes stop_codon:yes gene_type:complete